MSLCAVVVFLDILPSVRFGDHRRVAHTAAVPGQEFGGKICKFSEDLHVPLEVVILRHDLAEFIRSVVDLIVAGTLGIRKLQFLIRIRRRGFRALCPASFVGLASLTAVGVVFVDPNPPIDWNTRSVMPFFRMLSITFSPFSLTPHRASG